jgi:lysozyme family protein
MAKAEILMPLIQKWEGGYSNNKNDNGGCTMKGVTISTYRKYFGESKTCSDLKKITDEEWLFIFHKGYWNPCMGDDIKDQSVANILVDWAWMSGVKTAVKKIQTLLGITVDGIVGKQTINAINLANGYHLFNDIYNERKKFYYNLVEKNPKQEIFLKGWLNRLNDFEYQ